MDQLEQIQQAQNLLKDQSALRQVLNNPDTQKVLAQLQKTDANQLQAAAKAALKGDASALSGILKNLSSNPEAAKAMDALSKKLPK